MTDAQKRYFLAEGFIVGLVKCLPCDHHWYAAWPPDANEQELECPTCKSQNSTVISKDQIK